MSYQEREATGGPPVPRSANMVPLKCPSCGLQWNVREDSPESVTCPRCLATVDNPREKPDQLKHALPVIPLETETAWDSRASRSGMVVVVVVVLLGVLFFFSAVSGFASGKIIIAVMILLLVGAVIAAFVGSSGPAQAITSTSLSRITSAGQPHKLDYHRPRPELSELRGFGQAIAGVIAGISIGLGLFVTRDLSSALLLPLLLGLLIVAFVAPARALGIGLLLSVPLIGFIFLGLCFMSLSRL
jgi:hypothetical protein